MSALPKLKYTIEQYIELEKSSEERYEYFDGEVFAMAGSSLEHAIIATNVAGAINNRLGDKDCRAINSDVRVKVPAVRPYRYPDVTVVCGEPITEKFLGQVMLVNPLLLVEVLSPTTKDYDTDGKFIEYQSIESFQEYLLVAQDRAHVTRYVRQADNQWLRSDFIGLDSAVELVSLGVTLPLSEIYQGVSFTSQETPPLA
ncbi:MAG TPA: Uma2 family endonuclease [Blastocatellia bacterium]|nr:Uma2 family endonuclease [Blastocatellia bacterium]